MLSEAGSEELCIICQESLRIELDSDSDGEEGSSKTAANFIYDDVELPCHHHLHYDCARELHGQSLITITSCPACHTSLLTNNQFLVTIRTEGGVTANFDLGQDLLEQQELQSDPNLARNEALLSFCFSADHEAMQQVLQQGADVNAVQRTTGMSGLHLCALNNDAAGIRLLLALGALKDPRGSDGSTPLSLAISEGSHDAAYALQQ